MVLECQTCFEALTRHNKKVVCQLCSYECCRKCALQYITMSERRPGCMNCLGEWSMNFCAGIFSITQYNVLEGYIASLDFLIEQTLFPEMLISIERRR